MRTSGADSDTALFMVPVAVVVVLAVMFVGGPQNALRMVNTAILDALANIPPLWR